MIIAENFKIEESLLFLLSMRETLNLLIDNSNTSNKKQLKLFITNEASDYQIISLIVDGELPLNESNYFNELVLFERIRLEIKDNKDLIYEIFGVDLVNDVTKKIDSLAPKFSTKNPLLEDDNPNSIMNMLKNAGKGPVKPSKYKIDSKTKAMLDSGKKAANKYYEKEKASSGFKTKYDISTTSKLQPKVNPKILPKTDSILKTKKVVGLQAKITKLFNDLKQQATSASKAVTTFAKAHPAEISGVLLAVLAIYVSAKIYKRFYSKAAKSCSTYKGKHKTLCMKKFQLAGYKAQLIDLKRAATQCGLTKNPEKCVKTIKSKMDKINKKISKAV